MTVVGKGWQNAYAAMHITVRSLTRRADKFDDTYTRGTNCSGTVRQTRKGMLRGLYKKTLNLR
jgi:hypothetical protein